MRRTMRRADRPEGVFQKGEEFLHAVAELQARQLKRIGKVAHVLAGGCQQIHPPCGELCGLGLREIAAIAAHDNPLLPPARERIQQFTIIDRSGGQIKAAEPSRLITRVRSRVGLLGSASQPG
jgi:hypothetical protein